MSQPTQTQSNAGAVVIDANILISICSKEPSNQTAEDALDDYALKNWAFYAPGAILTEVLFVLCRKLHDGLLTEAEHEEAVKTFNCHAMNKHSSGWTTCVSVRAQIDNQGLLE